MYRSMFDSSSASTNRTALHAGYAHDDIQQDQEGLTALNIQRCDLIEAVSQVTKTGMVPDDDWSVPDCVDCVQ